MLRNSLLRSFPFPWLIACTSHWIILGGSLWNRTFRIRIWNIISITFRDMRWNFRLLVLPLCCFLPWIARESFRRTYLRGKSTIKSILIPRFCPSVTSRTRSQSYKSILGLWSKSPLLLWSRGFFSILTALLCDSITNSITLISFVIVFVRWLFWGRRVESYRNLFRVCWLSYWFVLWTNWQVKCCVTLFQYCTSWVKLSKLIFFI